MNFSEVNVDKNVFLFSDLSPPKILLTQQLELTNQPIWLSME